MKKVLRATLLMALLASCSEKADPPSAQKDAAAETKTEAGTALAQEATTQEATTKSEAEYIPVKVMKVAGKPFKGYGEYFGTVQGGSQAKLIAYGGGRVASLKANEGKKVKKGASLCDIEGSKHQTNYRAALLAEKIARQDLGRKRIHLKQGGASQLQVDKAEADFLAAQSRRIEAKKLRDGALCISPMAGVVVERLVEDYQELAPGAPTFIVSDLDKVKIKVGVPDIEGFEAGGEAMVFPTNGRDKPVPGKTTRVSRIVNSKSRTFNIEVEANNGARTLLPGNTVRVNLLRYDFKDEMVVPTSALITIGKDLFAYVVEDGKAIRRKVTILTGNSKEVVIKTGLKMGEQLIISGQQRAGNGAAVKVIVGT